MIFYKTINLKDETWTIISSFTLPKEYYGLCDFNRKLILVDASLPKNEFNSTLLHETLHSLLPEEDEDTILYYEKILFECINE